LAQLIPTASTPSSATLHIRDYCIFAIIEQPADDYFLAKRLLTLFALL